MRAWLPMSDLRNGSQPVPSFYSQALPTGICQQHGDNQQQLATTLRPLITNPSWSQDWVRDARSRGPPGGTSTALCLPGRLAHHRGEPGALRQLFSSAQLCRATAGATLSSALLHGLDQPQLHDKHICCCWKFYVGKN